MAKKVNLSVRTGDDTDQPVDLLALPEDQTQAATEPGGKRYVVEVGSDRVELTLEQLLELAKICLAAKLPAQGAETLFGDLPDLQEFVRNYPDVLAFPPEVEEQIRSGQKPLDAYRGYENSQLRRKLREMEQNEANRRSAIGSARSQTEIGDELDDLMAVYKSVFK